MSSRAEVHHLVTGDSASTSTGPATTPHSTLLENPEVAALSSTGDNNVVEARRGSLTSTPNPLGPDHQQTTTDEVQGSDVPPSSSVGTHTAPGKAGVIGENAMGAFGFGGTHVERPPEDQGLGEKIVNFLGV